MRHWLRELFRPKPIGYESPFVNGESWAVALIQELDRFIGKYPQFGHLEVGFDKRKLVNHSVWVSVNGITVEINRQHAFVMLSNGNDTLRVDGEHCRDHDMDPAECAASLLNNHSLQGVSYSLNGRELEPLMS